jgi:outer membrane lipoprotein SlyB
MKTTVALLALAALAQTAHAQFLRPETAGGALLGGIAGAVIGHNSGDLDHNAWRGAAIGTLAGGLIGSAVGQSRDNYYSHEVPTPRYSRHHRYGNRYAYDDYYPSARYTYSGYPYGYHYDGGSHDRYSGREYNRASTGLLLGGIAGAVIGHNSGDLRNNPWRGAAIGAGAGWLLGAVADIRARARIREEEAIYSREDAAPYKQSPAQSVPQTVIINNNYYGTPSPMTSANSAFGR